MGTPYTRDRVRPLEIDLTKCKAQEQAFSAIQPGNTICLPWGRGLGKSWFTRLVCYILVAQWDGKPRDDTDETGVRVVVLMPTLVQAKKVHSQLLISELEGRWKFLGASINKTEWRVSFPGGSWIQFVSADVADNSRGIRCDVVFIDEADDVDPEIVESITQPWFSEPRSLRITIIGGTPRRGRYGILYRAGWQWNKAEYWRNQDEGKLSEEEVQALVSKHFSFHATAYDAPKLVDPKYLAQVKRKTSPTVFAREWMCDPDSAEGLVYPMFDAEVNIRTAFSSLDGKPWIPFHTILVGIDHGYEDKAVFLIAGVYGHGKDSGCHVIWEYAQSHKTIEDLCVIAESIHLKYPEAKWFADSSGPSQIRSYEKRTGKKITHATHTIEDGVAIVASMLTPRKMETGETLPKMYIDPQCKSLIDEMGKYRRKRDSKNKELILDEIEDKFNHSQDSARYMIFHYFGKPSGRKTVLNDYDESTYIRYD